MEAIVTFITQPFQHVNVEDISNKISSQFFYSKIELETHIIRLQKDLVLKTEFEVQNFWSLVNVKNYLNLF